MVIAIGRSSTRDLRTAARWQAFSRQAGSAWAIVCTSRVNALVVGPSSMLDAVSRSVAMSFCRPITQCPVPGPLGFADVRGGTLILRDVARLTRAQQQKVLKWSESGVQILSMTSVDLFSMVKQSEFLDDLFYRLNVVRIDCDWSKGE
jgi:hypothetical protein